MGMSMNSPMSANAAISSNLASTSSTDSPAASPPRTTFSRPLSAGLKPTPRASSVLTRPLTTMRPSVGGRIPAIPRMMVDLPAPLAPRMPSTVPWGTSIDTCLTASMTFTWRLRPSRLPNLMNALRRVGFFSNDVR